jgi:AraC-like DNA-binding protein
LAYLWLKKRNYSNKFHLDYIIVNIILLILIPVISLNIIIFDIYKVVTINLLLHTASQIAFILHVESAIKGYKIKIKKKILYLFLFNVVILILTNLNVRIIGYETTVNKIAAIIIEANDASYYSDILIVKWISSILMMLYLLRMCVKNITESLTIKSKGLYKFWVLTYCIINIETTLISSMYYLGAFDEAFSNNINMIIRINIGLNLVFLLINPAILNYIPGINELSIFKRVSKKNYYTIIKKALEEQKLYLQPKLTIKEIEKISGVSVKNIREVILLNTKNNFNDYINKYRIDIALKLIDEKFLDMHTTVALGEKCGFNSHQSFFRAFKKNKNTTPKEYYLRRKEIKILDDFV